MVKILVCYYSRSGTTERMAREIAKGMEESGLECEIDLRKVEDAEVDSLPEYDTIILGSPTYYGLPSGEMKLFLDESVKYHGKLDGRVGGAFASSGSPAGGNETTVIAMLEALLIHGMVIKGDPKGDHYGPVVIGEPDESELERCRAYGRWMAEFTLQLRKNSARG